MKKILFVIHNEVSSRSILPIVDIFVRYECACHVFIAANISELCKSYSNLMVDEKIVFDTEWSFVVTSNPLNKKIFKGKIINVAHGSMWGNNAWSLKMALNSDVYFGISPQEMRYLSEYLKTHLYGINFIPAGNPSNDYLKSFPDRSSSSHSDAKFNIKNQLGLDERKVILLASHWTSVGNLRTYGASMIDALYWNFPDHQIIATCHPKLLTNPKSEFLIDKAISTPDFDADWIVKSLKNRANSRVKVILDRRIADLMFVSDIFVGDHSSSFIEAAYFELPLVLRNLNIYFDKNISSVVAQDAITFANLEQLIEGVRKAGKLKKYSENINLRIKELFHYNIGNAAQTIFEEIQKLH